MMSTFFNDTLQGLSEAVAIEKGEIEMVEVPDMPEKTYRAIRANDVDGKNSSDISKGILKHTVRFKKNQVQ